MSQAHRWIGARDRKMWNGREERRQTGLGLVGNVFVGIGPGIEIGLVLAGGRMEVMLLAVEIEVVSNLEKEKGVALAGIEVRREHVSVSLTCIFKLAVCIRETSANVAHLVLSQPQFPFPFLPVTLPFSLLFPIHWPLSLLRYCAHCPRRWD